MPHGEKLSYVSRLRYKNPAVAPQAGTRQLCNPLVADRPLLLELPDALLLCRERILEFPVVGLKPLDGTCHGRLRLLREAGRQRAFAAQERQALPLLAIRLRESLQETTS